MKCLNPLPQKNISYREKVVQCINILASNLLDLYLKVITVCKNEWHLQRLRALDIPVIMRLGLFCTLQFGFRTVLDSVGASKAWHTVCRVTFCDSILSMSSHDFLSKNSAIVLLTNRHTRAL